MKFNGVELTDEAVDATWQWFADNRFACAAGALAGEFFVNDVDGYAAECMEEAERYLNHEGSISFTFLQRAYFIQTGESVAFLP